MSRTRQAKGKKGSLRAIQWYVNEAPAELDKQIAEASGGRIKAPLDWKSPLRGDGWAEYSDGDFLDLLGISLPNRSLNAFWPKRGPQWDALGKSSNGQVVLVEAKAHVAEIISPPSAAAETSFKRIKTSLAEVAKSLGTESSCDWTGTFYQYSNRLAHLYLLRELNNVPAWLVFVCFTNDRIMKGPATAGEWRAATEVLKGALGLQRHRLSRYILEVYPDARPAYGDAERLESATV
ncbi:MAG: hypothetical protein Q8N53_08380 [Longimicrobiales bacterium]|nr:hypothetical protein [Longimicrobiales bacterium]